MITRHKPPIITLLAVVIFYCASAVLTNADGSPPESVVALTPGEQAWLSAHPEIVLGAPTLSAHGDQEGR
jgi:hypothetical protein